MTLVVAVVSGWAELGRNDLHVVFTFLLIELTFLLGGGVLVLLVLRDEIVHVGLGLGELHLVHAFTGVPNSKKHWLNKFYEHENCESLNGVTFLL